MWLLFGVVTLITAGIAFGLRRYQDRWPGERQPHGHLLQLVRNPKSKELTRVIVGLPFDGQFDFECKPEKPLDRWAKASGLASELQVGHDRFDKTVYLLCDDARLRAVLRSRPEAAEALQQMIDGGSPDFRCKRVISRGGTLRAVYQGKGDHDRLVANTVPRLQAVKAALPRAGAFEAKKGDPLFLRSVIVLAASSALAILTVLQILRLLFEDDTIVVDRERLAVYGLVAGGVLLCLLVGLALRLLAGTSRLHLVLVELLLVGGFGSFGSGVVLVQDANMTLDRSPAQPQAAMAGYKEKRVSRSRRGRRTSYHVTYHGAELPNGGRLRVSRWQYERMQIGMPVVVNYHDGAFGIRWVSSIDPAHERVGIRVATAVPGHDGGHVPAAPR